MENWVRIKSFEDYEVSDLGRIRKGDRILKNQSNKQGRQTIALLKNKVSYMRTVSKLVADAFLPGAGLTKHKDGNLSNCTLDNIQRKGTGATFISPKLIRGLDSLSRYSFKFGQIDEDSTGEFISREELMNVLKKLSK